MSLSSFLGNKNQAEGNVNASDGRADDQTEQLTFVHPSGDRFDLGEDVYSLIFISPICSPSFWYALGTVCVKLLLFTFLAVDLREEIDSGSAGFYNGTRLVRLTQFFLLPVAVALQEDLIFVYTRIANIRYDKEILVKSKSATEFKFALSFVLRFFDGLYSLIINFVLLLITNKVLSLFLNFAALGFLQSIDDVAFHLAANGYLGDRMEDNCVIVQTSSLPRRVGDCFTNALDSILYVTTYCMLVLIFIYVTVEQYKREQSDEDDDF